MKIAIIGAGALGSLVGGLLARVGYDVWLYNPSNVEHVRAIRSRGLYLETLEGETWEIPVSATDRVDEIPTPPDLVGIFVKAYRTEEALRRAAPLIAESTWLLSLQNGLGFEELFEHRAPGRVLRGTTAQGATLLEPGRVRWAGRGPTRIGLWGSSTLEEPPQRAQEIIRALDEAGLEASYEPHVGRALWEKLLINAAINPLTALFEVPNGALVDDPALRGILHDLVREAMPIVQHHVRDLSPKEALEGVERVCRATARNLSSMLQDVQRGRPTEIEFITGTLVREGERLRVPTPLHRLLWELVRRRSPRP